MLVAQEHVYTLGELLELNIMAHQEAIGQIATQVCCLGPHVALSGCLVVWLLIASLVASRSQQAVQESALEELFAKKVQAIWTGLEFTLNPYKESKDVFVLGSVEEVTVRSIQMYDCDSWTC